MKKIICFTLSLMLLLTVPFTALADEIYSSNVNNNPYVVDHADLLSAEEETALEEKLSEISKRQSFDVVIVTENTLDGKSPMEYADDYYDYNNYGYGENRDGCLLLLAMDTRDWWISTCGYGITALTDYGIQFVGEQFVDGLGSAHDDFYNGFIEYAETVDGLVTDAKNGDIYDINNVTPYTRKEEYAPENNKSGIAISLVIALIVGLIVVLAVKAKYKPVKFNRGAVNYLVGGSLQLRQSYDNFLYSNVTSHRIESDSSSSGGGSSTHTSSSGSSHGGGGGKF